MAASEPRYDAGSTAVLEKRCVELESELAQVRSQAQRLRQKVAMLEAASLNEKAAAGRAKQAARELEEELKLFRAAAAASEQRAVPATPPQLQDPADVGGLACGQPEPAGVAGERDRCLISLPAAQKPTVDISGLPYDHRPPAPEAAQKALCALRCALCSLNQFHRTCSELHSRLSHCPDRHRLVEEFGRTHSWTGMNHDADRLRQLEERVHCATLEIKSLQWGDHEHEGGERRSAIGHSRERRGQQHRRGESSQLEQFVIAAALQMFAELSRRIDTLFPSLQEQRQLREKQESVARARAVVASEEARLAQLTAESLTGATRPGAIASSVASLSTPSIAPRVEQQSETGDESNLHVQSPSLSAEGVPNTPNVPEGVAQKEQARSNHAETEAAAETQSTVAVTSKTPPVDGNAGATS